MNELNYIINVETEFIGNIVINELLILYKNDLLNILSDKIQVSFYLKQKVKEIDILLIGYLILIKENNSNINFTFIFSVDDNRSLNILKEYMFFSSLSFGKNVFDIKIENDVNLTKEANLIIKNNFFSRYFTPLIFISEKNKSYNYFFNTKIKDLSKSDFDWEKRNSIFFNQDLFDQRKRDKYVVKDYKKVSELLLEYFIYYLDDTINEKNIYKNEFKKLENIKKILNKIDYKELNIFSFIIFYLMVNGFIRKNKLNKKKAQIILKFFDTSKDIERGIKELVKNFLVHTDRKYGLISLRVFEKSKWRGLKKYCDNLQENKNNGYDQFLLWTESLTNKKSAENLTNNTLNFKNVIDINVIDLGNNGIIPTFINESCLSKNKFQKENTISELFVKDIEKLVKGDFLLKNFFILDSKSLLLQQTQRLTSHLGLLIFSKIVIDNHGFIRVFSKNKNYNSEYQSDMNSSCYNNLNNKEIIKNEFYESYSIFKNKSLDSNSELLFGTCIQVTLPINEQPLESEKLNESEDEKQTDKSQFRRIVDAFLIDVKPYQDIKSNPKNVIYFYQVNFKDELLEIDWIEIPSDLQDLKIKDYILDFKNCNIDESGLYRFLGLWEYYYPKINLIIINIDNKVVKNLFAIIKDLYELNKDFKDADDLIFWNDNTFTLLYSFVEKEEKLFYFADILYGKTLDEFINANSHVALNNYNSISLVAGHSNKSKSFKFKTSFKTDILSENNILPLDLIIKSNEKTLFEHNAEFLLQQKMPNDDDN